jgi:hypothetical protein
VGGIVSISYNLETSTECPFESTGAVSTSSAKPYSNSAELVDGKEALKNICEDSMILRLSPRQAAAHINTVESRWE